MIEINSFLPITETAGPGKRFALWVQGCSIQCKGCCNPHMFKPGLGKMISHDELLVKVSKVKPAIDGITLLGGEPFDQAAELIPFVRMVERKNLSIIIFTGHLLDDIKNRREKTWLELLSYADLLVDGPFILEQQSLRRRWIGSDNQRLHFLSGRWQNGFEAAECGANTTEIHINGDQVTINGYPLTLPI